MLKFLGTIVMTLALRCRNVTRIVVVWFCSGSIRRLLPRRQSPERCAVHIRAFVLLLGLAAISSGPVARADDGLIDEAKIGLSAHDIAIGTHREESGVDGNGEVLFVSPDLLAGIFAPRPHVGLMVNSDGGNSFAYAGLTWTATPVHGLATPEDGLFAGLGLGGAVHDGPDESSSPDHKGLGTRPLFHESVECGYRATGPWSVSLFLDHVSNADLGPHNPGLTDLGVRSGYKF